ncbi:DUF4347 domain-containing protein [Stutzerimonas sp. NM35]
MKFIERFSRKSSQQPQPVNAVQAPLLMALEPRIMFDASVGVVAQDAETNADPAKDMTSADKSVPPAAATASGGQQGSQRQEVVFVDGQVTNVGELLQGLSGNAEVVILDPDKDGLQQMADYLRGRESLDAIHLLSHGADGTVQMGNVWLASSNLAEHREALESIGAALKADGDLMLYGCNVGETAKGQSFLDELAVITGADVAASSDDTGGTALGGNWTLERTSGAIETTAVGAQLAGYDGLLAGSFSGGLNNTAPVLATGNLPKMVIGDFNNDGRDDILYQVGVAGSAWRFAAGNANGTFTDVTQAASPFSGVTLIDAPTSGTNYYAADFDGDGDTDLLGVTSTLGPAYLYRNTNGVFTRENTSGFNGTQYGVRLVVGDFNGDGAADILYQPGSVDADNSWRYALNNGNGTFTDMAQSTSPFAGLTLAAYSQFNYRVIDFDGDGDLDILYTLNNTTGALYINTNGVFTQGSTAGFPAPAYGPRSLWGDFDGDGDVDVFWQVGTNGSDWNYGTNNGDGSFTIVARAASPFAGLTMVDFGFTNFRIGDFDGDGDTDVVGSAAGVAASVFYQSGSLPKLVSATPADNSQSVSPAANITLTFDQSVSKGAGNIYIVRTSDNAIIQTIAVGSGAVTGSGTTWTIDPPADMVAGEAYAVRIDNKAFANANGQVYKGIQDNTTLNFTTSTVAAPVIGNLNGDAATYVEDSAYVLLDVNSNATVSDADSSSFNGGKLTVQVTGGGTAAEDVLFIRNQGNGANEIQVDGTSIKYNGLEIGTFTGGNSGTALVITLTSEATATTTAALLHNLAYRNSNTVDPSTTSRSVSISMDDGAGGNSAVSVVTVAVQPVNDAPVVNATGTNPTYTENGSAVQLFSGATINTVESGQKVIQMTFTVTNVANGAVERLVIDGTDVTLVNGTNVTTTNNGAVVTVSVSSGTATITVNSNNGMDTATAQTILNAMAYRNDSESPNTASRVVTLSTVRDSGGTDNGGINTTAVGISSSVTVVGINDAPVLAGGPYNFATINEDTTATGVLVSTMLSNYTMNDPDVGALRGIAVIGKTGNGTWQYSTDNSTWTDFGAVSGTSGLLLNSTAYVRYVPDGANGETATLTIRGWDQTTGTASANGIRSLADTTSNGGTTAFSSATGTANQVVSSVNDAPVMIGVVPALTGLTDSSTGNAGALVSTLLGGVSDVDTGAAKGMAITGLTATYGKWQFSTDAGSSWNDVGVVSTSSALILTAQNLVRFVPDGIHGETATITYKAWDQTNGTAGFQGDKVNTTTSGGASAYSTATDTASVVVTAVNDAPVVTVTGSVAVWTEANNTPSSRIVVDSALTVSDPDGPNPNRATARLLTYDSSQDTLAFVNDGVSMGNIVGSWNAGTGILTLTSAGNLATTAQFQAALRAVTYGNSTDSPNTTTRTVQFIVTDGSDISSSAVTRDITIVAVNDSPTISAPTSQSITEDIPTALSSITFSDVDSTLGIVTFSVGTGTLSASGAGGVTVGGSATALTLSGTLANINTFIANNRLVYIPAANASGDVTLTINVNTTSVSDATTTMTLQVTAVNDAPVVAVPPSITVTEDVSSVITGISFNDIDAGINAVTATFSVPSGTLSATTGLGVTVGGSGTGLLTLTGSLADINFFIAANGLTFKTAQDATASVILTVNINDGGFSGSGGEQTDTKTVALNVTAVNDAPVNNVPGAQTASQNVALGFNTANGNSISISDVDSGNGLMSVTLTAVNGTLSLGSLTGINMANGTGQNSITMTIEGNRTNINAALQTLTFKGANNYLGAASVTIETNDNGNSGTGGAKTDVDTISINVIPVNPKVTNVSAQGLDRTVKVGDEVLISMTWDQVVNVDLSSGSPTLLLETGLIDRNAVYVSGTGSNTLVFKYTVQAGDTSTDLDFQSTAALQMNGAVITNNTSDLAVLTLPTVGGADSLGGRSNIVVDGVVPVVGSVSAPSNGTYITGQNLDFTVNLSEAVTVDTSTGVPRIAVTLDTGGTVYAEYVSGSGGSALVFRMTVLSGQLDSTGVSLGNVIDLHGGAITDLAGNTTEVALNNVAALGSLNVDGVDPTVVSVVPPVDGSYKAGSVLTFTVNASEVVTVAGTPRLALDIGGVTLYANYVSGSGTSALVFQYTIQAGNNASAGIGLPGSIDLNGSTLRDAAGNDMNLQLNAPGTAGGVVVDTSAPIPGNIVRVDASPTNSGSASFTVTFSEDVSGVDISDFTLSLGGSAGGSIASVTRVDGRTYTVLVDNLAGTGTVQLNLNASGTGIADAAGNALNGGLAGASYSIDRVAPSVTSVTVPASGIYTAGQTLDFTVNTDEAVRVDSSGGTPRLAITLDNGQMVYADYLSGSDSTALTFRLTVTSGMAGNSTFAVVPSIDANGGTLRDAMGNDANIVLNNVGNTSGILVDARAPSPSSIVVDGPLLPTDRSLSFILTFDEAVSGVDAGDFSVLGTSTASGVVQSVQQINGQTYRIVVGDLRGQGALSLSLNAPGSGIQDGVGNLLVQSLTSLGQSVQTQDVGDLEYRVSPPDIPGVSQAPVAQPQVPGIVINESISPLAPGSLFEVRSVGGGLQPLGTIFLGAAGSAPSFIAQVFGSSDSGIGGSQGGFLGFGGGEGGVFGSSTFANIFGRDVPGVSEMNVFNGSQWRQSDLNQGLRGVFGAPTLGQQLHHINEADQRQVRELAMALSQPAQIGRQA